RLFRRGIPHDRDRQDPEIHHARAGDEAVESGREAVGLMTMSTGALPKSVRIVEVGPRDGLQNEAAVVPLAAKVALIEALAGAGLKTVESGSFVSPKWVPQMADTAEVLAAIARRP